MPTISGDDGLSVVFPFVYNVYEIRARRVPVGAPSEGCGLCPYRVLRAGSDPRLLGIGGVKMNTTRRNFIKVGAGAVAATSCVSANSKKLPPPTAPGERTAAPTGKTGDMIYS